jgi:ferrous iron transport protein A
MSISLSLDQLPLLVMGKVSGLRSADQSQGLARQLEDIGFVPGEQVQVLKRAWIAGDPMVVRVGLSTFALRKSEAQLVELEPLS